MKVLIADDDSFSASVLQQLLNALGTQSDTVSNGLACCEALESRPGVYQLVFMDVFMPEMDGLEATQAIKTLNLGNVRKVIGITGDSDSSLISRCIEVGMDEVIVKPIRREKLLAILNTVT